MGPMSVCCVLLLSAGPPAGKDDPYLAALNAAVHHFAREGELDHLKAVLARHPDLVDSAPPRRTSGMPSTGDDWTPLMEAACHGQWQVVEYLIPRGARIDFADGRGWTPLHQAAAGGDLMIVTILVEHGAKVDARSKAIPAWTGVPPNPPRGAKPENFPAVPSKTPMDLAAERNHEEVVSYLRSPEYLRSPRN